MQRALTTLELMTKTLGLENLTAKVTGQMDPQIFLKKDSLAFGERFELWHSFVLHGIETLPLGSGFFWLLASSQNNLWTRHRNMLTQYPVGCSNLCRHPRLGFHNIFLGALFFTKRC